MNDYDSSDSAVSIHSIVSDNEDFNSDNEAPNDKFGQIDKIIKNHPGEGLNKPSKSDFIIINFKCYFDSLSQEIITDFYEKNLLKEYIYKLKMPDCIIKSIQQMRIGERAKITMHPKHGFRKIKKNDLNKYLENINDQDCDLFEKLKKFPIIYEINLINIIKLYDLAGDKSLMKLIINIGGGVLKPSQDNQVVFNLKFFVNEEVLFEFSKFEVIISDDYITKAEMILLKSMKKFEKSKIEISKECLDNSLQSKKKNGFIYKVWEEVKHKINLEVKNRFALEVELLKIKNNFSTYEYKNTKYNIKKLNKGIGNVFPWKNSQVMIMTHVEINENIFHSNMSNTNEFVKKIKEIKNKIKLIKNFEQNTQFIVDEYLNKYGIYYKNELILDPLLHTFPNIILKEIIPKMKLLETIQLEFYSNLEYLKIHGKEIINDNELNNYKFTICLLNFQETPSIFNKIKYSNEQIFNKLSNYKDNANYYFKNKLLNKSKKINNYLVDEFIKFVNLECKIQKLTHNASNFDVNGLDYQKLQCACSQEIMQEIKKITSNLILIFFKLRKFKKCQNYINYYFLIFDQHKVEEKILFLEYKTLMEGYSNYDEAKQILEKLLNHHENSQNIIEYKNDLKKIESKLKENQIKKNIFVKKMFNFDQ